MPPPHEVLLHLSQLLPQPLPHRPPPQHEFPPLRLPADMREAEEVEGLRLPLLPSLPPTLGGEPTELEEAGLLGVQLQRELPQAFAELLEELRGVRAMLEAHDEVVGVA